LNGLEGGLYGGKKPPVLKKPVVLSTYNKISLEIPWVEGGVLLIDGRRETKKNLMGIFRSAEVMYSIIKKTKEGQKDAEDELTREKFTVCQHRTALVLSTVTSVRSDLPEEEQWSGVRLDELCIWQEAGVLRALMMVLHPGGV